MIKSVVFVLFRWYNSIIIMRGMICMGTSKAKKKRMHDVRNGKRDVTNGRGTVVEMSTHVRKTKTLLDRKERNYKKYGKRDDSYVRKCV